LKRIKQDFISLLDVWYKKNKRKLPFRKTKKPYLVWLSEIILQQTQMSTGLVYYENFKKKFPTLKSLSDANEDDVVKCWEGLGYYNRAKNLHITARYINKELSGKFPTTQKELIKLKGVGRYTSSAIASICFNEKTPAIDSNVYRVFSRVFGIKKNISSSSAYSFFYKKCLPFINMVDEPGEYNQSIMDFGSIQCVPKNPLCNNCILNKICYSFINSSQHIFPVKNKTIKKTKRYFYYLVFNYINNYLFQKRQKNDIWKGLYDFYLIEKPKLEKKFNSILCTILKNISKKNKSIVSTKTTLSHQEIHITFVEVVLEKKKDFNYLKNSLGLISLHKNKLGVIAKPKVINDYLKKIF